MQDHVPSIPHFVLSCWKERESIATAHFSTSSHPQRQKVLTGSLDCLQLSTSCWHPRRLRHKPNILVIEKNSIAVTRVTAGFLREGGVGSWELFQGFIMNAWKVTAVQDQVRKYNPHKRKDEDVGWRKVDGSRVVKHTQLSSQSSAMHRLGPNIVWLTLLAFFVSFAVCMIFVARHGGCVAVCCWERNGLFLIRLAVLDDLQRSTVFFTSTLLRHAYSLAFQVQKGS